MQIIPHNQPETMTSSQLAEMLGYAKKEINRKIKVMFFNKIEGGEISPTLRANGQVDEYHLPELESKMFVAKHDIQYLEKITQFWIDRNKQPEQPKIPTNFAEALQLAADQAKQLELAAPKVAFVDNLVDKTNLLTATQVGQKHKISAIKLNRILAELKVYNGNVKRCKVFQQWFIDNGYGEMKKNELGYDQPLFTNAGEVWINQKLTSEGII